MQVRNSHHLGNQFDVDAFGAAMEDGTAGELSL
jgi:hypothetical protein